MRPAGLAFASWLFMQGIAFAACAPPVPVRFPAGAVSTDLQGGVARAERACFSITARQGQTLAVTQPGLSAATQPEEAQGNIAIQLYRPPGTLKKRTGPPSCEARPCRAPGKARTRHTGRGYCRRPEPIFWSSARPGVAANTTFASKHPDPAEPRAARFGLRHSVADAD